MKKYMKKYRIGQDLSDEEVQEYARDFRGLLTTPEWAAFCALVASHEDQAAYEGHFSDSQPPGYYRGYLTALRNLRETPKLLVEYADEVNREVERQAALAERLRLKQAIPEEMLEPANEGGHLLRPTFGGNDPEAPL